MTRCSLHKGMTCIWVSLLNPPSLTRAPTNPIPTHSHHLSLGETTSYGSVVCSLFFPYQDICASYDKYLSSAFIGTHKQIEAYIKIAYYLSLRNIQEPYKLHPITSLSSSGERTMLAISNTHLVLSFFPGHFNVVVYLSVYLVVHCIYNYFTFQVN